jgi:hypothetical protein
MGYLKPAARRASARFDADFLTTDETEVLKDEAHEIVLGVDVNRQRIIILLRCCSGVGRNKNGNKNEKNDENMCSKKF